MKMQTSRLEGAALDVAALQALHRQGVSVPVQAGESMEYAHLLAEIVATQSSLDLRPLCQAMGVSPEGIERLLERAHTAWNQLTPARPSASSDWRVGGVMLEHLLRHQFKIERAPNGENMMVSRLQGDHFVGAYGPTVLVAAARCLVEWVLGDVVDVPDDDCL